MKIVYNNILLFKGFKCMNIFGLIFARKGTHITSRDLNHEYIHTVQMRELLYIGFYIWYIIEYLIRLIIYLNPKKAYRMISFEQEAYEYENVDDYVKAFRIPYRWFKYISQ